jgi:gelsolin
LKKSSLNEGDSFILFCNASKVFVWHGAYANPHEKNRSNSHAEKMCTRGTVVTLEQEDSVSGAEEFWAYLGEGDIAPADEDDEEVENFAPLLFKLAPGEEPEQVAKAGSKVRFGRPEPPLSKDLLDEADTFLLDAGWDLFLWIGKSADRSEKVTAMTNAELYCKQDPRTADLPMTIVKSGWEPSDFNQYFG